MLVFVLCVFIYRDNYTFTHPLHKGVSSLIYFVIAIIHFILVFAYETNAFTIAFLFCGIGIISFQILGEMKYIAIFVLLSNISTVVQLLCYMCSLFPSLRNFFQAIISYEVVDIREPSKSSIEIFLLSLIINLNSIALNKGQSGLSPGTTFISILEELKAIARSFYFNVSWILFFGFSVTNSYPTCIKLGLLLIFLLGSKMSPIFKKISVTLTILMILFLVAQLFFVAFTSVTGSISKISHYIGIYFADDDTSLKERNS